MRMVFSVALRALHDGSKTTTWRRNATRWSAAKTDANPEGWGSGLLTVYCLTPSGQKGRGEINEASFVMGTRRIARVEVRKGSEMTDADARADGFPDAPALKMALAELNRMAPASVDAHYWAVVHMGEWVNGPTMPPWPEGWLL